MHAEVVALRKVSLPLCILSSMVRRGEYVRFEHVQDGEFFERVTAFGI